MKLTIVNPLRRALALILCLAMLLPAIAAPAGAAGTAETPEVSAQAVADTPVAEPQVAAGDTLYLKPSSDWLKDGAWFAAYFYRNGDGWAKLTDSDGDGYYEGTIPSGQWTNVIFCRMDPAKTALSFDSKWNQTGNLTLSSSGTNNCYSVPNGTWDDSGNDYWSTYTPSTEEVEPTYIVAGNAELCGSGWTPSDTANQMTLNADTGKYEIVYSNVPKGSHAFKVTNGTWDQSWGGTGSNADSNGNYIFTLDTTSNVKIIFNASTGTITVIIDEILSARNVIIHLKKSSVSWSTVYAYAWYGQVTEVRPLGDWSGTKMTTDAYNSDWYTITISDVKTDALGLIFNDGTNQTGNINITDIPASGGEYWFEGETQVSKPSLWFTSAITYMDIYFDATLSKLSYEGSSGYYMNTMPVPGGKIYAHFWGSATYPGGAGDVELTLATSETYTDVYKGQIPADATNVLFYSSEDGTIPSDGSRKTGDLALGSYIEGLSKPCFFADGSDDVIYSAETKRSGYWGEADAVRDADTAKNTTPSKYQVVDIATGTDSKDADYYVYATFFDYYSDYELNGYNRDGYATSFGDYPFAGQRNWVAFRQLNQALSDYYETGAVSYPIYVGHFQPDEFGTGSGDIPFSNIAATLSLYGYAARIAGGNDQYRKFFAINNSYLDAGEGTNKSFYAMQGLVDNALTNSVLYTSDKVFPLFDKAFIEGDNSKNTVLGKVYSNVKFPFDQRDYYNNGVAYYVFDSYETTLEMKQTSGGSYFLDKVTGDARYKFQNLTSGSDRVYEPLTDENGNVVTDDYGNVLPDETKPIYGFFPFNGTSTVGAASTYNYGFGTRFDISFKLTSDGMVLDKNGTKVPIKFEFSGDDDVWVFIDGNLVLDIGGAHGAVTGVIDFSTDEATGKTPSATVYGVKYGGSATKQYSIDEGKTTNFTLSKSTTHTLTMFYMERGMWESNMKLVFNIANSYPASLNVTKEVIDGADPDATYTMQVKLGGSLVPVGTEYTVGTETRTVTTAGQIQLKAGETASFIGIKAGSSYEVSEISGKYTTLYTGTASTGATISIDADEGTVSGTLGEASAAYVTVTNAYGDHKVVIDYGLPVDVTVENSNDASLYAVGAKVTKTKWATSASLGAASLQHGSVSMVDGKVRYTPSDMQMTAEEVIGYAVKYTKDGTTSYFISNVTVIPATTIYYEDNFASYASYSYTYDASTGKDTVTQTDSWSDNVTPDGVQDEDRPGSLSANDTNNVYGYDSNYTAMTTHSMGNARKVTVWGIVDDRGYVTKGEYATATFTFQGTGFDVISMTSSTTGTIVVEIVDANGKEVKNYVVDTYYGYTYGDSDSDGDNEWYVDPNASSALYQVPVIKVDGLDYGKYTVTITASYAKLFDHDQYATQTGGKRQYDFYLDAIRIYDPADDGANSTVVKQAYTDDGEGWPDYFELRNQLISKNEFNSTASSSSVPGIIFIDGNSALKDSNASANDSDADESVTDEVLAAKTKAISDYANYGPNNELYLAKNQAIAFELKATGSVAKIQIALKTVGSGTANVTVYNASDSNKINELDANGTANTVAIATATDLYYEITDLNNSVVVISNANSSTAILSITNIKVTYTSAHTDSTGNTITSIDHESAIMALDSLGLILDESETPEVPETPVEPEISFTDIEGKWYEEEVLAAAKLGFVSGYEDGTFRGDKTITRAEFVTMLVLAFGLEAEEGYTHSFTDVSGWAEPFIAAAASSGVVYGVTDTTFAPNALLTREQMMTMIYRAAECKGVELPANVETEFKDAASISAWAQEGVDALTAAGLVSGFEDGTLRPQGTATRAQCAAVLYRLLTAAAENQ